MAQEAAHIPPQFGNCEQYYQLQYAAVVDDAWPGKGGKAADPIDAAGLCGETLSDPYTNQTISDGVPTKPSIQHRYRINNSAQHVRRPSNGEDVNITHHENKILERNKGSQEYLDRMGARVGSGSSAIDKKSESWSTGTPNRSRPERHAAQLPRFGDWDANNPASGDGFTMIFDKARDEKKTGGALLIPETRLRTEAVRSRKPHQAPHESAKWFCSCFQPSTVT